jgi:hypothetical protein
MPVRGVRLVLAARPSPARGIAAVVVVLALAGCGGGASPATTRTTPPATTTYPRTLKRDTSRTAVGIAPGHRACDLLPAREVAAEVKAVTGRGARLEQRATDSGELSICRYAQQATVVRVILDGAADATRRYFNMNTEASELPRLVHKSTSDFRLVWDVGDDDTYGGAGAFWQPSAQRLVAIRADRIVRVIVSVPGSRDRQRRILASRLARRELARAVR